MPMVPVAAPEGLKLAPPPRTGPCYAFSHVQIANGSFLNEKCSAVAIQNSFLSLLLSLLLLVSGSLDSVEQFGLSNVKDGLIACYN